MVGKKLSLPDIKVGDVFATKNPMVLGRVINFIQAIWAKDSKSTYSHAGIITDQNGGTFESLWTIKRSNLAGYRGEKVIIARWGNGKFQDKVAKLQKLMWEYGGQWYPMWRLPMHLIPPLAKISIIKRPVCSELVAKYLYLLGARHGQWAGTNPDTLVDEWRKWRDFEIIFEGVLE